MNAALVHPGALGDLVLAMPLVQRLAGRGEHVTLFAAPSRATLLAGRSAASAGFSLETFARYEEPFDRVISLLPESVLPRAETRGQDSRIVAIDGRPASIEAAGLHASEYLCRCVFGDEAAPLPAIAATQRDRDAAAVLLADAGTNSERLWLVHPGSGGRAKCWTTAGFAGVARELSRAGNQPIFVLGEAERDRWGDRELAALAPFAAVWPTTLEGLAGLISLCHGYIGNDAGPTHLAAAMGVPTIAIFGPTDSGVWGPRGRRVAIVRGDPACGTDWGLQPGDILSHADTQR